MKAAKRDRNGNLVALCNAGETWSPRRKADVIKDIVNNKKSYYVEELPRRKYVRVISGTLQTTPDSKSKNSLDKLPEG